VLLAPERTIRNSTIRYRGILNHNTYDNKLKNFWSCQIENCATLERSSLVSGSFPRWAYVGKVMD
jgi:hypothetical protein